MRERERESILLESAWENLPYSHTFLFFFFLVRPFSHLRKIQCKLKIDFTNFFRCNFQNIYLRKKAFMPEDNITQKRFYQNFFQCKFKHTNPRKKISYLLWQKHHFKGCIIRHPWSCLSNPSSSSIIYCQRMPETPQDIITAANFSHKLSRVTDFNSPPPLYFTG